VPVQVILKGKEITKSNKITEQGKTYYEASFPTETNQTYHIKRL
jgi:hypothetical protein